MLDHVKMRTLPLLARGDLDDFARTHPMVPDLIRKQPCSEFKAHTLRIELIFAKRRYGTLVFLEHPGEARLLYSIEANIPMLLHGHNGRLIKNQEELVLGLTRFRWLAAQFVDPACSWALMPGFGPSAYVARIEIGLQLADLRKEILIASHLTGCRSFRTPPMIKAGLSTTHSSTALDIAFYDKGRELGKGTPTPESACCTRIEARFKTSKKLASIAGLPTHAGIRIGTFSFEWLFNVFRKTLVTSLVGTLAKPQARGPRDLRPITKRILELCEAIQIQSALAEHETLKGKREGNRTKAEVFGELARRYPVCLEDVLAGGYPDQLISEVEIPDVERSHRMMMKIQGWPDQPDVDIATLYSRAHYFHVNDSNRRIWLPD